MKTFVRWLFGPLVRWASDCFEHSLSECPELRMVAFQFVDSWGTAYSVLRTPEQAREFAWLIIGMADAMEEASVDL